MKKIIVLVVCTTIGWNIYNGDYFAEKKVFLIKNLVDKVATTPVSAEEFKAAFEELAIYNCHLNGKDTRNGYGTLDDCLYNFETLAKKQCISQIDGFKSKTYNSVKELKSELLQVSLCSDNIITEAYLSKYR